MSEPETRLSKLKRYVPFLYRTKEYLASSPEESLKITQLIDIISNAGEQLLADTLERCENFCRVLYQKFGKEDEIRVGKQQYDYPKNPREQSRFENTQHFRGGPVYDETPRSPSPEETKRFSLNSIPKAIPNQREDFDLRMRHVPVPVAAHPEPFNHEIYRPSPKIEHVPRHLRTEPVEIPTMPLHAGMNSGQYPKQDQDYRSPYDQSMVNGSRLSYEERHVSYNRGTPDVQIPGTSYPKRESRFDRYGNDRPSTSVGAGRPYEEPIHSGHQPNSTHWDANQGWDPQARDRGHSGERDRPFQNRGPPNLTRGPPSRSRWDTQGSQPSPFPPSGSKNGPPNRPPDVLRESVSGSHHGSTYRNGEPVPLHNSRMDWGGPRREQNHGSKSWSNRDSPAPLPHHTFERDFNTGRNYRQPETSSRHGLLPYPNSSGSSVPNISTTSSSSYSHQAPRVPNHPSSSNSQTTPLLGSPPGSRREDPRLASRSKQGGGNQSNPPGPNSSSSAQGRNPPSMSNRLDSAQERSSSSGRPNSFRTSDPRNNRRPQNKSQSQSKPSKQNATNPNASSKQGGNVQKEPLTSATSSVESGDAIAEKASGSNSRNQDDFVSPLDSLYSGPAVTEQTGRGYGVQTYKIPKNKNSINPSKQRGKKTEASAMISPESSANEEDPDALTIVEDAVPSADTDNPTEETSDKDPSTPLDPPEKDAVTNTQPKTVSRKKKSARKPPQARSTQDKSVPQSSRLPTEDTTMTSSDDVIRLSESEGQENIDDEDNRSDVTIALAEDNQPKESSSKGTISSGLQDTEETSTKKKGRTRSALPLEVARLREDLTDFMKGGIELGTRRCRSKSAQPVQTNTSTEDDQGMPSTRQSTASKRGSKRKASVASLTSESEPTHFSPVPGSEEGNDNLDDSESTYSSSVEPPNLLESSSEQSTTGRGSACSRGRGKGAPRGRKPKGSQSNDPSTDATSKSRMRKKPLAPTHLSLRGRRSMYEDSEPNEQVEDRMTPMSGDQYFQCQRCSYLGQKIIHHYVNEHSGIEIPFAVMPESVWATISNQGPANPPPNYKVDADLLSDLSWIPARPNYTNPVQCKLCAYTTSKRSELIEHVMVHALPANCKYSCTLCGLTETNFFDMLDHIAGHTGEFRYRCNYCDFRVAHRPGIKHHMSSMHESQDGLFYTTISLADADQLWIYGFVCRTCRFVQMTEDRLERHQAVQEACDGYRKVNLISLIQDPNAINAESSLDNRTVVYPAEKEQGVFLCPALEQGPSSEDLDDKKLTESLKLGSTSFIETLAERLSNPEAALTLSIPSKASVNVALPTKESVTESSAPAQTQAENSTMESDPKPADEPESNKDSSLAKEPNGNPTDESKSENELEKDSQPMDVEPEKDDTKQGKSLLAEVWKPNALLETTISKLVGKLGEPNLEVSMDLSTDSEDTEEVMGEEGADDEDVEEEEEEEEEEDSDDDSDDDASDEVGEENSIEKADNQTRDESVIEVVPEENPKLQTEKQLDEVQPSDQNTVALVSVVKCEDQVDVKPVVAPTDSADFLRIESVMSLNDFEEEDNLDPVASLALFCSVTMAKSHLTFPYSSSHDRIQFSLRLKDPETYKKMLDPYRIRNLFKCMAHACIFSSNSPKDFVQHLQWHSKHFLTPNPSQPIREKVLLPETNGLPYKGETMAVPDFYLCSYCPYSGQSSTELTEHTVNTHGNCTLQCTGCFYRAQSSKTFNIHSAVSHQGKFAYPFRCRPVEGPPLKMGPLQLKLDQVSRYRCCVAQCRFSSILRNSYVDHMITCHPGVRQFRCRMCNFDIVNTNTDYTQYFLHMNSHEMGFLQCAFCSWGSDLPTDALIHLCLQHPSLEGKLFSRSSPSTSTPLSTFWTPGLPNTFSRSHQLHLDQRHSELFDKVVVMANQLSPEDDIVFVTDDDEIEKSNEGDESLAVVEEEERGGAEDNANLEKINKEDQKVEQQDQQVTEKVAETPVGRKEPDVEFHGFGAEEQAIAKEQTESIVVLSDAEEDTSSQSAVNDGTAAQQVSDETGEPESEEYQEGLYGRNLYMCGNIGCDETAETASAFKDHLLVCDLARDSRFLTCRHCAKNMKLVSNLMEHLRSHGVKRYLCGLCSYRANSAIQVRKHFKTVHRVNIVDEVPIGPGPGPANSENILHALYPREMMARLKLRSRSPNKKGVVKTFSCKDRQSIPMKSILPFRVQCAHCGYASNIRTNMIRHLALHECNDTTNGTSSEGEEIIPRIIIPDQDPVNPVPCLETPNKGMMFDKMANLAYSSHVKDKPLTKERMGSNATGDSSGNDPKSQQPIFVPDHQRYVCGYNDCGHLTINESMLKYHLQTLHKNAVFTCPHCQNDDDKLTMDSFRNHLKMHGPKLYKCGHCVYYHWQQQDIEYHLTEKHPNRPPWQIIVRDPSDAEVKRMQTTNLTTPEKVGPSSPWNCSLCKQTAASVSEMLVHVDISHGVKSQFKCALCPVRCNVRSEFDRHFAAKHPNQEVQVLTMFYKVETSETSNQKESPTAVGDATNFEPLWKKDANRLRHIRGILLEENEIKSVSDSGGSKTKTQTTDPVYGRYGAPVNNQYSCPMCENYRSSYGRDLKVHLYRELNYKKFLCSVCNEGSSSRVQALNHVGKQHPNSNAYIREITSNRALEEWVEKVIKIQTDMLKTSKANTPVVNKKKTSASSSPATSAPSSPVKSPTKVKKPAIISASAAVAATATLSAPIRLVSPVASAPSSTPQKLPVITIDLDSFDDIDLDKDSDKDVKPVPCLSCHFMADSEQLLEEHVVATHANDSTKLGKQICLECGFKATPKQSLANHQKKTKHTKVNELIQVKIELVSNEDSSQASMGAEESAQPAKRSRTKTQNPYRCKHCNFSALTEHGMNLHWQRIHSVCQLPLEFDCDLPAEVTAAKPESAKIYYKCQLCPVQPGLYEEMREHSKMLHPNSPIRLFRITSKVRFQPESSASAGGAKGPEPAAKMAREEVTISPVKEVPAPPPLSVSSSKPQPQLPKLTPKTPSPVASGSSQTVFVVAPAQPAAQPAYGCVWCQAKFVQESQVIRHHASHPSTIPLRYTCLDTPKQDQTVEPSSSAPPKPELAVMEIRFGCPVCPKYFISLSGAQQHVGEHKQAWKCGHCTMLFGSPTLALQHWKEVHPGLQGRLESIDSPSQIVERLSKGITLIRVQLNMKSLLKDKSSQPSSTHSKEAFSSERIVKGKSTTTDTPPPLQIPKISGVARKSTSTNLFLKENVKQQDQSSPRDNLPSNP